MMMMAHAGLILTEATASVAPGLCLGALGALGALYQGEIALPIKYEISGLDMYQKILKIAFSV